MIPRLAALPREAHPRMTSANATYLYCVVRAAQPPALDPAVAGMPDCAPPRALDAGAGLWLVIADAPAARYGAEALEAAVRDVDWVSRCAVAHERVVEQCLPQGAVVPMKLLTLFASDASAHAAIAGRRAAVERAAERVAGCREYGLRALVDRDVAQQVAAQRAGQEAAGATPGAAFLLRKRSQQAAARETLAVLRAQGRAVVEELARRARAQTWRDAPEGAAGEHVAADAVLLVDAAAAQQLAADVQERAAALAPQGLQLVLSGPWPAYHFVADAAPAP